jgi:hypothetical protein
MLEPDNVREIVCKYIKEHKNANDISVTTIEKKDNIWIVHGTCPIDLEGHPWRESFKVEVDRKGRIQTSRFRLL